MYCIEIDSARNFIDVTLAGFLSVEEARRYAADLTADYRRHATQAGYRMRIDASACDVQQQAVLGAFQQHVATFPRASRIAVVNTAALTRMQLRRVLSQPYTRIFERREEALAWLMSEEDAA